MYNEIKTRPLQENPFNEPIFACKQVDAKEKTDETPKEVARLNEAGNEKERVNEQTT